MMSQADPPPARVEVLGPLRLFVDGAQVDVRGPRRRAVLALLAIAEGRTVTVDHLVDSLWPSVTPELARQTLHTHVSRLRGDFAAAAGRLQTGHDGYRIDLGDDGIDVARARSLLAAARTASHADPDRAFAVLSEADSLWRGPLLADLTDIGPIATAVEGYVRLHRDITDALIVSAIAAGHAEDVLSLASSSRDDDPLREPAVLGLMRALAATGQAPAALQTARDYRHRLADETGLDPSPALGILERDIASGTTAPAPVRVQARTEPVVPASRLIGRESQVAALHRLLAEQRLVTVMGPGGVGKSRVAFEVASPGGTATALLLAPVTDPAGVPHALAAAMKLTVVQDDVLSACVAVLSDHHGLLVIDNCEHLLDAVRDLVELLLTACPGLTILTTSRERLGLAAEFAFRLSPLPLPAADQDGSALDPDRLRQVPSVAMFLDRAARVRPGPPPTPAELRLVADIVRRLDGIPLAIELAAGRLSSFSLTDLHRRLDRSLDLLGGGRSTVDARHRTLRATVEWSYGLLPADEQRLFRQLAVFVDGIDLDAAERLAVDLGLTSDPGSVLAHLVDSSMIDADLTAGTRYRMLETLRAFGHDRLVAAGEDQEATGRLISWAVELTREIGATLATEREPAADALLRRELPNLRAGWQGARARGSVDDAAAMVVSLFLAIGYRDLVEIRGWADDLADDPTLLSHPRAAAVLGVAGESAYQRGDLPRAERLARTGLDIASGSTDAWYSLTVLSVVHLARGEFTAAADHALAAAAIGVSPADNLVVAAMAKTYAGDIVAARELNDRGRAGAVSPTTLGWVDYVAGEIESSVGRNLQSEEHYARAIAGARASGAAFLVGIATVGLLSARTRTGRVHDTLVGFREVIDYFARTGNWNHQWVTLRNLADLLRRLGDDGSAALIDAAADQAPDAPAAARFADSESLASTSVVPKEIPGRQVVLDIARQAIEHNLKQS